jgi:uncharacterized SAM-binding protein YcdF (DUF218 family)
MIMIWAITTRSEKTRKKLLLTSFILLLVFSNTWLSSMVQYPLHAPPMPMRTDEQYELGIVLGGMTSYDRVNKEGHFNMSSDRFIQVALLYKKGHIKKILASGGQNGMFLEDNFREAEFIAKNLIDLGIPPSDILIENKSRNTIENAAFSKKLIDEHGGLNSKAVLITSAFHMPRAKETFEQAGIPVRPYPCAFSILPSAIRFGPASLLPSSGTLDGWGGIIRESIGRLYLKLKN